MPVVRCQADGKPGYKWGSSGHCYTYEAGDRAASKQAFTMALYGTGYGIAPHDGHWIIFPVNTAWSKNAALPSSAPFGPFGDRVDIRLASFSMAASPISPFDHNTYLAFSYPSVLFILDHLKTTVTYFHHPNRRQDM